MLLCATSLLFVGCKDKNNPNNTPANVDCNLPANVQMVDLGLSVKWADMNVGAHQPSEYGAYFAWGETEQKSEYSWGTYFDSNFSKYRFIDETTEVVLAADDDAAAKNWGGKWRMPTEAEQNELRDSCNWVWTDNYNKSKVAGYVVTSKKTNNSIFLPAAGYYVGKTDHDVNSYGCYWSSSLKLGSEEASSMYFYLRSNNAQWQYTRNYGQSVRPVMPIEDIE